MQLDTTQILGADTGFFVGLAGDHLGQLGLVLGLVMLTWALSTTHWPTVRWLARHPNALLHSPELGWSVAEEAARRLAAPALRFITAWCAVRSHWRATLAAFVASVVVPVAEGM